MFQVPPATICQQARSLCHPLLKENQVTLASTALAGVGNGNGIRWRSITFEVVASQSLGTVTLSQVNFVNPDGERFRIPISLNMDKVIEPPQTLRGCQ